MRDKLAASCVLLSGLCIGLWGLRWGLPGPARWHVLPEHLRRSPEAMREFSESWRRLYEGIAQAHRELRAEEPITYSRGVEEFRAGWRFPPGNLLNSCRAMLLQSEHPDEKKSFIILAHMRPWKLEFKPLYVQYGGAFIYPLGAFLKAVSWLGACRLVPEVEYYLLRPEEMGLLYLCGRLFVLLFQIGCLWVIYSMGRRLASPAAGVLAALLFALCPNIVDNSHVVKPHPFAAFWTLSACWFLVSFRRRRGYWLCGACAGMAVGANFSLVFLLALPLLLLAGRKASGEAEPGEWRPAAAGCLAAAAVALLFNPYLVFAFEDFIWETRGVDMRGRPEHLLAFLPAFWIGMGPFLAIVAAAGVLGSLASGVGGRRLLAATVLGCAVPIFVRFGFFTAPGFLRLYYPLVAVAVLLGVDLLWRLKPRWRALAAALLLADTGLRGVAALENMRLDSGPSSTRARAAAWIEAHVPAGSRVGLSRYPEPAHTPPLRFDRYHWVITDRLESLKPGQSPRFLVLGESGREALGDPSKAGYRKAAEFRPWEPGWAKARDNSVFANMAFTIYERGGPGS